MDYPLWTGFVHLGAGIACGMTGMAAGYAIGHVGDAVSYLYESCCVLEANSNTSVSELTSTSQKYSLQWCSFSFSQKYWVFMGRFFVPF
jgi:hypothetical protein